MKESIAERRKGLEVRAAVVTRRDEVWKLLAGCGRPRTLVRFSGPFPALKMVDMGSKVQTVFIIIDCASRGHDYVGMCRQVVKADPRARVALFVDSFNRGALLEALRAGVRAILSPPLNGPQIAAAARCAEQGGLYLSPGALGLLLQRHAKGRPTIAGKAALLTSREQEVLDLLSQGLQYKEIADRLSVTLHTVNNHLYAARQKLGAHSGIQALHIAYDVRRPGEEPLPTDRPLHNASDHPGPH